jgi:hypothetical protein
LFIIIDFIRLDLPSSGVPRPDLVAELIANYSSSRGWSSVRGEQIKVSFESFANALCLPPHGTPAGSVAVADRAAVASAAREFTRVYIGAPAEAATAVKRRLPGVFFEKDASRGPEYTTELLWELVKHEMEHLPPGSEREHRLGELLRCLPTEARLGGEAGALPTATGSCTGGILCLQPRSGLRL